MSKPERLLSDEEVRQIRRIIETLNESNYDYLELEFGDLKLTVGKAGQPLPGAPAPAVKFPESVPSAAAPSPSASIEGTKDIVAPMIGRFYSQAEPGAAPYVRVGSEVKPESTVGLIEAMKMFNAVHAGVEGVVAEICVQDAALVEYGQVLFRVRPKP